MQLTHKIALDANQEQTQYFAKAAGTSRMVWNWGLAEWNRQYEAGLKPTAFDLKKQFNKLKYIEFPWLIAIHRDSHSQPFTNLGKAFKRFFADKKAGKPAFKPRFKCKGLCVDRFYVANDKFSVDGLYVTLPKIGKVRLTEELRFKGKILGATVSRTANRWFIAIQVDMLEHAAKRRRVANSIVGVDLGITTAVTVSNGEKIPSPKPLTSWLRRLSMRDRRRSRKRKHAKEAAGFKVNEKLPKGTKLSVSNNYKKVSLAIAKTHAHIANVRKDFTHKVTTKLCRENQTVVIEDLNVKGMLKNEKLARPLSDVGMGEFRRQMEYKTKLFGVNLVVADRWYPSSKLCSECHCKNENLTLKDRIWTCAICNTVHDRDLNAAKNLKRLATETALPMANLPVMGDAVLENVFNTDGKVTLVRYECGL